MAQETREAHVDAAIDYYRGLLRSIYGKRRWILALDVLDGITELANALKDLGATRAVCIANGTGVGPAPDPEFAPTQLIVGDGVPAESLMVGLRQALDRLADLPGDIIERVDEFDPARECAVIGTFFGDDRAIAERRVWAARPSRWRQLEDKTLIDAFWDELGVEREPSLVCPAGDLSALLDAGARLDVHGDGVVWVGDNKEGFHGAAEYVRWVRDEAQARHALAFFAPRCDQVRVMPFLEGTPCSIHGIVFANDEIALRPCEMVVLRRTGTSTFFYAGAATFWDPPDRDRDAMRSLTYRVGKALREQYDYRGVFTLDGVMTRQGFRPTELNPRFGGAIGQLGKRIPELSLLLTHFAIVERDDVDWRPRELERLLIELGDRFRAGSATVTFPKHITERTACGVVMNGETPQLSEDIADPRSEWTVHLGPGPSGALLRAIPNAPRVPVGPSHAPRVAELLNWLDQLWQLGLGKLEPAREVR